MGMLLGGFMLSGTTSVITPWGPAPFMAEHWFVENLELFSTRNFKDSTPQAYHRIVGNGEGTIQDTVHGTTRVGIPKPWWDGSSEINIKPPWISAYTDYGAAIVGYMEGSIEDSASQQFDTLGEVIPFINDPETTILEDGYVYAGGTDHPGTQIFKPVYEIRELESGVVKARWMVTYTLTVLPAP